ncbi:sigma-70 family RNA polymerase sigma factor [Brucellaceae bacterium C25G]
MKTNISIVPKTWQKKHTRIVARKSVLFQFKRECLKMNDNTQQIDSRQFELLMTRVIQQRDMLAYEQIFKYFGPRVKSYMMKLTPNNQLAEELMQETMITVWHKADRFDPDKGALSTWIFTIARNLRIDAIRRDKRPEFDPYDPAFVPDEPRHPDTVIILQQSSEQLRQAMQKLPSEQSELLKMSFYEAYSQSAIAEKMNIPLGTVKSRMRLAFEKLRISLRRAGDFS